ncbi:carbon-phosphorus lyase complex subunit PhnI [Candidatus Viridilinea mediisalina]|uniref:Carbon-phosphorus lyase n=1 Tax=Candidatus Viridilinea mediisalina TaxID=2024553 RepID=A0A2A6RPK9_9CHLR|nr:carbon-phosphorus lyase complex subunit PhnI [Candidatus Viridilinea mediisalina]PDW04957.1 carbon-phosphorus lyase [Candidatus Viridilinea mediisalina]
MGYVAARGGTEAVLRAEELAAALRLLGGSDPLQLPQISDQLRHAVSRAMHEGALYAPLLAALAVKQAEGDSIEASFLLRAYRTTLTRVMATLPASGRTMACMRRISASFKDIPGGQMLGPAQDYQIRLLQPLLALEDGDAVAQALARYAALVAVGAPQAGEIGHFPKVADYLRAEQLLVAPPAEVEDEPFDLTRQALIFPCPRSARLQALAQADSSSLMTFAYSSVRGYGDAHPTLAELRYGYLPIQVAHPLTGEAVTIGEIEATECEIVSKAHSVSNSSAPPSFNLGYGFAFGQSEVKVMSMAILDSVLTQARLGSLSGNSGPAADEEFLLLHCDGIEASGFTAHYKLPHYVTFEADLRVLDRARKHHAE